MEKPRYALEKSAIMNTPMNIQPVFLFGQKCKI